MNWSSRLFYRLPQGLPTGTNNRKELVRWLRMSDTTTTGTPMGVSRWYSFQPPRHKNQRIDPPTATPATLTPTTRVLTRYPTVVFESNHLLAVDKPPGWHSIPHTTTGTFVNTETADAIVPTNTNTETNHRGVDHALDNHHHSHSHSQHQKCLVTYLKDQRLGGGSHGTFLHPLHRIDQPCSGILLLGKTSKAASRIQTQWSRGTVHKLYYVVVAVANNLDTTNNNLDNNLNTQASPLLSWRTLHGDMMRHRRDYDRRHSHRRSRRRRHHHSHRSGGKDAPPKGWSVQMRPVAVDDSHLPLLETTGTAAAAADQSSSIKPSSLTVRRCTLEYRVVSKPLPHPTTTTKPSAPPMTKQTKVDAHGANAPVKDTATRLLQVQTRHGSRHMIRALLSSHGWTIMGDVRYSKASSSSSSPNKHAPMKPLWDASVALHASSIRLPDDLVLGDSSRTMQRTFRAPIPETWLTLFGWSQGDVEKWEDYCRNNGVW